MKRVWSVIAEVKAWSGLNKSLQPFIKTYLFLLVPVTDLTAVIPPLLFYAS